MKKKAPWGVIIDYDECSLTIIENPDTHHYRTNIIKIVPSADWYFKVKYQLKVLKKGKDALRNNVEKVYDEAEWAEEE